MARRRPRSLQQPASTTACCFCGISEDDEAKFGKLWNHDGIVTHYYCLLLSSNMEQNGNDDEGILGFLSADIQKELRRGRRLYCTYCKKPGATLGCCSSRCKKVFHLPCGLQAGSLHQYFGEFRSFCITHRKNQEIDEYIKEEAAASGTVTCYICYEEVNPQNTIRTLWAPCCRKNAWFHRNCVQRLALSAGYFFKCPLCNNKQEFQKAMLEHGIFIPHQDASWELVPNAYQELLHRHNLCDAVECLCPKGRSHIGVNAKWELVLCRLCGSQGVHRACGQLKFSTTIWECAECVGMLRKNNEAAAPSHTDRLTELSNERFEDDSSSSSSDISVGRNPSPLALVERPDSPPLVTSPIKLRPGPRSFKLQQAVQNAKSLALKKMNTPGESTRSENPGTVLSSNSKIVKSSECTEKSEGEVTPLDNLSVEKISLSTKNISVETPTIILEDSNAVPETSHHKSIDSKRREAELIVIDSDDEIEIINEKPNRNVLTTMDGTKIPVHSLYQATTHAQKVLGLVKLTGLASSEPSESLPNQLEAKFVSNGAIPSETSNLLNTHSISSTPTVTKEINLLQIPKPSATNGSGMAVGKGKDFRNKHDLDVIVVNKVLEKNTVMNLKITNVTSLRQKNFVNVFQEPNVAKRDDVDNNLHAEGVWSELAQSRDQQMRITQGIDPMYSNSKRKSAEHDAQDSSNLHNKEIIENRKKARTSEPKNSGRLQKDTTISRSINLNGTNGEALPVLAPRIPLTYSSNAHRSETCATTFQARQNAIETDNRSVLKTILNPDTQIKNGFHKHPTGMNSATAVQNTIKNNKSRVKARNNEPMPIAMDNRHMQVSNVTKTYGSMQPQIANQVLVRNTASKDSNIHNSMQNNQQIAANGSQNRPGISSRFSKSHTMTQKILVCRKTLAPASHTVHQSNEDVNMGIQRHSESGRTLPTNISLPELIFFNSSKICTDTTIGSIGNQPNVNNVSRTQHAISQAANGISIPSSCDGDAGSSPAVAAGFAHQANSRSPVHATTEPVTFTDSLAASDAGRNAVVDSSIYVSDNPTYEQRYSSPKRRRKYCDRPRLIPEDVPLQNLRFRILDQKIVQIIVSETYAMNISPNTGNLKNIPKIEDLSTLVEDQKPEQSKSSLKSGDISYCDNINIHTEDRVSGIAGSSKNIPSLTESLENSPITEFRFEHEGLSSYAATVGNSKTKSSCVTEKRYNIRSEISDAGMNEVSLKNDESYSSNRRMDSVTKIPNKSLTCARFENDDNTNLLCVQHKENLPNEEMSPVFNNRCRNSKNLCERDSNIITMYKQKGFSENMKQNLVNTTRYNNSIRSVSSVDFNSKTRNSTNNEDDKKKLIGLNRVSKCLGKSFDDSPELKLSTNCYNNSKKIVDRSSEFNRNVDSSDTNTQDSLKNNFNNIADSGIENGNIKVLADSNAVELLRCLDTANSCESRVQAVIRNSMPNNSSTKLSFENIHSNCFLKKPINTIVENQINSFIKKKTSRLCASDHSIKVRIDLDKIKHGFNSEPQISDKYKLQKTELTEKCGSKNVDVDNTNNSSYPSKTQIPQNLQDTENPHARKRFKYNSELLEKESNS